MKTNKKLGEKLRFIGLIVTGMTVGLMTIMGPYLLLAAPSSSPATPSKEVTAAINSADCRIALKPLIDKEQKSFQEFIQQTFANKSDTSVLVDTAVERYRSFRKAVLKHVNDQLPTANDVSVNLTQRLACEKIAQDALIAAESALRQHVRNTAQGKKTTKLVQKLKTLNTKLGGLQRDIGTFKGYMDSFASKLPCYVDKCIK